VSGPYRLYVHTTPNICVVWTGGSKPPPSRRARGTPRRSLSCYASFTPDPQNAAHAHRYPLPPPPCPATRLQAALPVNEHVLAVPVALRGQHVHHRARDDLHGGVNRVHVGFVQGMAMVMGRGMGRQDGPPVHQASPAAAEVWRLEVRG
jgi:hypothetical protein